MRWLLETASESGAELRAAITQTGDVIWSMHKKKNSASVLAGEMILTFFKGKRVQSAKANASNGAIEDPAKVLSAVFDACLTNGAKSFTSEALFNRLIMELWHRRALGCLSLDRDQFTSGLEERGWTYDSKRHIWSKGDQASDTHGELALFGT